jgi:hypothetical protein
MLSGTLSGMLSRMPDIANAEMPTVVPTASTPAPRYLMSLQKKDETVD